MAKRPPHIPPEQWRKQRDEYWKRVNRGFNVVLVIAVLAFVLRNCVPVPS